MIAFKIDNKYYNCRPNLISDNLFQKMISKDRIEFGVIAYDFIKDHHSNMKTRKFLSSRNAATPTQPNPCNANLINILCVYIYVNLTIMRLQLLSECKYAATVNTPYNTIP